MSIDTTLHALDHVDGNTLRICRTKGHEGFFPVQRPRPHDVFSPHASGDCQVWMLSDTEGMDICGLDCERVCFQYLSLHAGCFAHGVSYTHACAGRHYG